MGLDPACIFAHTLPNRDQADWEPLEVHAAAVAKLARQFTAPFQAAEWGELLGRWHDLGKVQPDFQRYIRGELQSGPPHAWLGALAAANTKAKTAIPIALAIAGHHTGLSDLRLDSTVNPIGAPTPLTELVQSYKKSFGALRSLLPASEMARQIPELPQYIAASGVSESKLELFTRFLFSALVDADRVATAGFYAKFNSGLSADDLLYDEIEILRKKLDQRFEPMTLVSRCRSRASTGT